MDAVRLAECLDLEWQEPTGCANLSRVVQCDHAFREGEWTGGSGGVQRVRVCEQCGRLEAKGLAVEWVQVHQPSWPAETNEV